MIRIGLTYNTNLKKTKILIYLKNRKDGNSGKFYTNR